MFEVHTDFVSDMVMHEREQCLVAVSGDGTLTVNDLRTTKVRSVLIISPHTVICMSQYSRVRMYICVTLVVPEPTLRCAAPFCGHISACISSCTSQCIVWGLLAQSAVSQPGFASAGGHTAGGEDNSAPMYCAAVGDMQYHVNVWAWSADSGPIRE